MNNVNLGIVLDGWIEALRRHDLGAVERHLHPDVVWEGVREDLRCPDRDHVLENLRETGGLLPEVEGIELCAAGDQVLFGVRSPDLVEAGGEPLHGEIHNLLTIRDGLIVRMRDFKTREQAIAAMRAHQDADADAAGGGAELASEWSRLPDTRSNPEA